MNTVTENWLLNFIRAELKNREMNGQQVPYLSDSQLMADEYFHFHVKSLEDFHMEQLREQKPDAEITDKYIKEEAKHFSEGWGDNDDEKSFIAGYKAALLKNNKS